MVKVKTEKDVSNTIQKVLVKERDNLELIGSIVNQFEL